MSWKEFTQNKWTKFIFWALLYLVWVIWLGNFWWLLGLGVIFDIFITRKVHWNFWKKRYKEGEKHSSWNDWLDAVIFAVIVVTFINTFFFQAFKIPSSSMESSLYTGDQLFVSKLAFGPRVPQTPLTVPFTHNTIFGKKSYSTLIQNKYRRLKGFRHVKRGDYVVFGYPNGDTVLRSDPQGDYYAYVRRLGKETVARMSEIITRPVDKKDFYVKRCVAVPGDTLEIRDGLVWVNGEKQPVYPGVQYSYQVRTDGRKLNAKMLEKLDIAPSKAYFDPTLPGYQFLLLTEEKLEEVRNLPIVQSVAIRLDTDPKACALEIFPYTQDSGWTRDYFGPLWIPRKGATVPLTQDNVALYKRIITTYEGGDLEQALREGSYTFKQDYYFMMGDNRHDSADSRYFGFVPEDHIAGRPAVIWLSLDKEKRFPHNLRWRRFLKFL